MLGPVNTCAPDVPHIDALQDIDGWFDLVVVKQQTYSDVDRWPRILCLHSLGEEIPLRKFI